MGRSYCSRCMKAFQDGAATRCPRIECDAIRPEDGWPSHEFIGARIDGRYHVLEMLGSGGAGLTYRCRDRVSREEVAVKVLHADRRLGMLAQRLGLEAQILELLEHPGVVPFRGVHHGPGGPA